MDYLIEHLGEIIAAIPIVTLLWQILSKLNQQFNEFRNKDYKMDTDINGLKDKVNRLESELGRLGDYLFSMNEDIHTQVNELKSKIDDLLSHRSNDD